jgi:hypothetical protein
MDPRPRAVVRGVFLLSSLSAGWMHYNAGAGRIGFRAAATPENARAWRIEEPM